MTTDDVHGDDMVHPELSDEQLAALLDGNSDALGGHPVADALIRARRQLDAEPAPEPGAALSEFLGVGRVADPIPPSVPAADVIDVGAATEPTPRRIPVLTSISAFIGTLTGKVLLSTTVAAASLGGAHAAGVVDVPGLPDVDSPSMTETLDDDSRDGLDPDDNAPDDNAPDDKAPDDNAPEVNQPEIDESDAEENDAAEHDDGDDSSDADHDADESEDDSGVDDSDDDDSEVDDSDDDDSDDDDTTTTTSSTTTTIPSSSTTVVPAVTLTKAYTVAGVGTTTVTVTDGKISLVSAVPGPGWILDEAGPDEDGVESTYTNGDLETRIDFEIEDGQLRVRVREENDATDERTERFEYFPLN